MNKSAPKSPNSPYTGGQSGSIAGEDSDGGWDHLAMALIKTLNVADAAPYIQGDGVFLRHPRPLDYSDWAQVREESRAFLSPWEPVWPPDDLTRSAFRRRLRRYAREIREGTTYPFLLFRSDDRQLLGGITLSNVARGVQQSCTLGYWSGVRFAGQGYMTRGVRALIPYVFEELQLHRLQAACLPENESSKAVLRKCGFREEGYLRGYLRINGAWRDHVVFGILRDDPRP